MRVLLLTLALCCLVRHATPETLEYTVTVGGVTFNIYSITDAAGHDLTTGHPCPQSSESLAVFESEEEYKGVITAMVNLPGSPPAGSVIMVGLGKADSAPDGDAIIRTYGGLRPAPYVNFFGTTAALGNLQCAYMTFDPTIPVPYSYSANSPWHLGDLQLDQNDLFMCMERADPDCTQGVDCYTTAEPDRVKKTCFWRPYDRTLLAWYEAKAACYKHGGHLMDLIEDEDIVRIKEWSNDYPTWADLWLGLKQKRGEGHPTWSKGQQVDQQGAWDNPINYGSSSNFWPYAGLWDTEFDDMNLFPIAEGAPATEVKAFATCEATLADYCKFNSPDVKYAEKTVCCDDDKLVYTCIPGWEFPDGTTIKKVDCSCDADFDEYVPSCILRNPCNDHRLCGEHGECIFTNQKHKPYYCNCEAGFDWNDAGHTCVDINECNDYPCGRYGGNCVNIDGSYWCTCDNGYWENGQCKGHTNPTPPPVVAVHTMTIYFHVNMNYNPHMNDPDYDDYDKFKEALEKLTEDVYRGDRITVDSFEVEGESNGNMKVKVVFNLYIAADVTTVSRYVWKFYSHIKNADYFTVNAKHYPYYSSVYYESSTVRKEIPITSVCSIFDSIRACGTSYCEPDYDGYSPKCQCREGFYGKFCNEHDNKPVGPNLTDTEIGLIVAVCILFLLVICMPFCLLCCIQHCRWMSGSRKRSHHAPEYYTNNAYSQSPTYVAKPAQVATRYPQFRVI